MLAGSRVEVQVLEGELAGPVWVRVLSATGGVDVLVVADDLDLPDGLRADDLDRETGRLLSRHLAAHERVPDAEIEEDSLSAAEGIGPSGSPTIEDRAARQVVSDDREHPRIIAGEA